MVQESQSPAPPEKLAYLIILLTVLALSLIKIGPTDTSWHLATAKLAFSSGSVFGSWPTSNTFSYTYPDYPLYQQYPLFQSLLYVVYENFDWGGLSVLHCGMWISTFLIWCLWAGPSRIVVNHHCALLILALGLHQRMLPRPLMLSLPLIFLIALCIERYRLAKKPSSFVVLALMIGGLQTMLALTHQVFPVGFLLVFCFCVHLGIVKLLGSKLRLSTKDKDLPTIPLLLSLVVGATGCLLNPLGLKTFLVPWRTSQTLAFLKPYVVEFQSIFSQPYPLILLIVSLALATTSLWKSRRSIEPYHLAVYTMGVVLGFTFWRGIGFAVSFLLYVYMRNQKTPEGPPSKKLGFSRMLALTFTSSICIFILYYRWISPVQSIRSPQPGIGKSLGQWPSSSVEKLKKFPPPGNLMNVSWYTGNAVIHSLYPEIRPFTDPRFEAYPPEFLRSVIAGTQNIDGILALTAQHDISWVLFQMKNEHLRNIGQELLSSGQWHLVAIDTVLFALVKKSPLTSSYIQNHEIDPRQVKFDDLLSQPKSLRNEQLEIIESWNTLFKKGAS